MNFESTFGEQYPGLFRYCHSLTGDPDLADDLAQEAFVRLYDRRGGGPDEGFFVRPRTWSGMSTARVRAIGGFSRLIRSDRGVRSRPTRRCNDVSRWHLCEKRWAT